MELDGKGKRDWRTGKGNDNKAHSGNSGSERGERDFGRVNEAKRRGKGTRGEESREGLRMRESNGK